MPQPLIGLALEVARKSWFFEWFHLEPLTEERPGHGQLVRFAPAGGAFHDLVALDLSLDADGRIAAASLGVDRRSFLQPARADDPRGSSLADDLVTAMPDRRIAERVDVDCRRVAFCHIPDRRDAALDSSVR